MTGDTHITLLVCARNEPELWAELNKPSARLQCTDDDEDEPDFPVHANAAEDLDTTVPLDVLKATIIAGVQAMPSGYAQEEGGLLALGDDCIQSDVDSDDDELSDNDEDTTDDEDHTGTDDDDLEDSDDAGDSDESESVGFP